MRLYGDAVLVEMDSLAKADAAHTAVERLHATLAQGLPTTPTRASVRPDPRRIAEVAMPGKQLTDDISRYLAVNQQATDDQRIIVAMVEQKAGMQSTRMLDAEIRLGLAGGNYFSQRPLLADKNPDARFRLTWDGELGGCLQDRERSASVGLAAAWGDFLQMLDKEQELYTPPSAGGLDI
jgi:hypothetical protein